MISRRKRQQHLLLTLLTEIVNQLEQANERLETIESAVTESNVLQHDQAGYQKPNGKGGNH